MLKRRTVLGPIFSVVFYVLAGSHVAIAANDDPPVAAATPLGESDAQQAGENSITDAIDHNLVELMKILNTPVKSAMAGDEAESLQDAPSVMTVLDADYLKAFGFRTVQEALDYVLGLYMIDDHLTGNMGIRGVNAGLMGEGGLMKVMLNGMPVNFKPTAGSYLGAELVPMSAIERIEIIRGPASAVYGADAFLGVVNVVLRDFEPQTTYVEANGAAVLTNDRNFGHHVDLLGNHRADSWQFSASFQNREHNRRPLALPSSSPDPNIPSWNQGETLARKLKHESRVLLLRTTYESLDAEAIFQQIEVLFRASDLFRADS